MPRNIFPGGCGTRASPESESDNICISILPISKSNTIVASASPDMSNFVQCDTMLCYLKYVSLKFVTRPTVE